MKDDTVFTSAKVQKDFELQALKCSFSVGSLLFLSFIWPFYNYYVPLHTET